MCCYHNSLWPSDAICPHKTWLKLAADIITMQETTSSADIQADTDRNNNVIITPKRHHNTIIASLLRQNDVATSFFLRFLSRPRLVAKLINLGASPPSGRLRFWSSTGSWMKTKTFNILCDVFYYPVGHCATVWYINRHDIYRGHPAKRALSAMYEHGG